MGSLVEKLDYLEATKEDIRAALNAKGAGITPADTFRSYAEKVENLKQTRIEIYKFKNTLSSHTTLTATAEEV